MAGRLLVMGPARSSDAWLDCAHHEHVASRQHCRTGADNVYFPATCPGARFRAPFLRYGRPMQLGEDELDDANAVHINVRTNIYGLLLWARLDTKRILLKAASPYRLLAAESVAMNEALARRKRTEHVQVALVARNPSAVPCAQRPNILMLSSLVPAARAALVAAISDGRISRIIPEDASALPHCRADETASFQPSSLREMKCERAALNAALTEGMASRLPRMHEFPARIGMKPDYSSPPACFALEAAYGNTLPRPAWEITPAASFLLVDSLRMGVQMHPAPCEPGPVLIAGHSAERANRVEPGGTNHFFHTKALGAAHRDRVRKARET